MRLATVFSGIGSVEFALKRLGIPYEIVFACDSGEVEIDYDLKKEFKTITSLKSIKDKQDYVDNLYKSKTRKKNYIKKTYLANYDIKDSYYFQDIRLLDGKDFKGHVDLLVGGSPCQSFSSIGSQEGLNDKRGNLFYEFIRIVKEVSPEVFIYENVKNIYNHNYGFTWDKMSKTFNSLGYKIYDSILDSKDYGIPQTRKRLFVVGFKKDYDFKFPKPFKLEYTMQDFLISNSSFGNFTYDFNGNINITKSKEEVSKDYYLSLDTYNYVMSSGTKSFYQEVEIDLKIARTILKTMGSKHRAGIDNYISDGEISPGNVRMLTEREALRLMGFTDDFKIVLSKSQVYKQAGNSIVVDVLIEILKEIFKTKVFGVLK